MIGKQGFSLRFWGSVGVLLGNGFPSGTPFNHVITYELMYNTSSIPFTNQSESEWNKCKQISCRHRHEDPDNGCCPSIFASLVLIILYPCGFFVNNGS